MVLASGIATPSHNVARAATTGPEVGAQWHALWAEETDTTRAQTIAALRNNKAQWVRIDLGWSMIEPQRGEFDTDWAAPFVDAQIDQARANGMKVLITFWRTPGWANGGKDTTVAPTDPNDYAKALAWAVKRWKGKVSAWEIWNEPNLSTFFAGANPAQYTRLLQPAYKAAKAADPTSTIVFGGTMYVDTSWISAAYTAGAKGHFDVMAVHPYQGKADLPPESVDVGNRARMMSTDALVQLMASKGDAAKPIWFTEFGWSVHSNTSSTPVWNLGVTEAQQADFLKRSVVLARQRWPQVKVMIWYNSRDRASGSLHTDRRGLLRRDFTARPALAALRDSVVKPAVPPGELIPAGSTWAYRDNGQDLGTSWRATTYNDSTWSRGNAPFGYGDGDEATSVAAGKSSYLFRHSFDVADRNLYSQLKLSAIRDDGIAVWLNGVEIWRDNIPAGAPTNSTLATTCIAGAGETESRSVTIPSTALVTGRNVLSVSLHNCSTTSSDASLDVQMTGQ